MSKVEERGGQDKDASKDAEPLLGEQSAGFRSPSLSHRSNDLEAAVRSPSGVQRAASASPKQAEPIMDRLLDMLPSPIQFVILSLLVFVFFGVHNILQEGISRMDGFEGLGSMLGYLEVLGVMSFSLMERISIGDKEQRVKWTSYMQLTLCLMGSSYLSTVGLDMINYPTKVVFRSCKLIPTMVVAVLIHKETFSTAEITSALAICAGLVLFGYADMSGDSKVSTTLGLALQAGSVVADAFLPNLQQQLFKQGASPLEVTYFTNLYVLILMTILGGGTGQIPAVIQFAVSNTSGAVMMLIYTIVAYVAISCHMRVVQKYGSVVAVLVGNMRKAGTISLSFMMFPKPFSMLYVYGSVLVLGGLTMYAYVKDKKRKAAKAAALAAAKDGAEMAQGHNHSK
eukprot:CAMPEP_0206269504 /NCGR_PEP_ID=MMETSP0047_2-20121206/32324_1 /ASSEMBLY_ACC=CAM_ASM_000192 /TAXON_ID=195065 /ORGANISM="Chroomonas mesostigmatica_cf, Strain CCMP1168" /LENGTH=397 /DNA_ID=CAMNT_0053697991 /DNA_START=86 /DNA_END=1279 /DNA_ORIENTATION=+